MDTQLAQLIAAKETAKQNVDEANTALVNASLALKNYITTTYPQLVLQM